MASLNLVALSNRDIVLLVEALRSLQREMQGQGRLVYEAEGHAFSDLDIESLVEHLNAGPHQEAVAVPSPTRS